MKFLSAFGDRSSTFSLMATLRRRKIKPVKMNHCIIIDLKYSLIPRWFDLGGLQFFFEHRASSDLKVVASYNSWTSKSNNLSLNGGNWPYHYFMILTHHKFDRAKIEFEPRMMQTASMWNRHVLSLRKNQLAVWQLEPRNIVLVAKTNLGIILPFNHKWRIWFPMPRILSINQDLSRDNDVTGPGSHFLNRLKTMVFL